MRPALKALVASRDNLINQVAVKIYGKRQREGQARPHPHRIRSHRLRQKFPELCEILDIISNAVERLVVDARYKAHVVVTGQTGLKAAGQAERPGYRHSPLYRSTSRKLDAAKEPDQRRFTGAVASEHRKFVA